MKTTVTVFGVEFNCDYEVEPAQRFIRNVQEGYGEYIECVSVQQYDGEWVEPTGELYDKIIAILTDEVAEIRDEHKIDAAIERQMMDEEADAFL